MVIKNRKHKVKNKPKKKTTLKKVSKLKGNKKNNKIKSKTKSKKVKKNIKAKKTKKKILKKVSDKKNKKIEKKQKNILKEKNKFEESIQAIITKLIEKNKVSGIYSRKIVEKAIPKKFRVTENIKKIESLLEKFNIKVLDEDEIKKLKAEENTSEAKNEESSEEEKKQTGKTDDPVRLYLRDMGAVELLSREGEIAIAKRIEAGREKMIGAICESPMTIRSIINWKESIKEGTMLLRDIVDLEQTYDMSDIGDSGENKSSIDETLKMIEGQIKKKDQAKTKNNEKKSADEDSSKSESNNDAEEKDDDEEDSLNVSLAAMEEKLKPKVLKDFDEITKQFKKLQKYSSELISLDKKNEKKYLCRI